MKFNEVVNGYTDQKTRIKALEDQVTLLHHEKTVAISKLQMANQSGSPMRGSFRNSVLSNGGKQSFTEIKVKPTGNMQGENDNHASNNQEKEEDYQEAEV